MNLSLPADSDVRKTYPLFRALFGYFSAALAGVAHHSWKSNEKHNPGQELHWSIDKSTDHADCVLRHLMDLGDMRAALDRFCVPTPYGGAVQGDRLQAIQASIDAIISEADALAWRALALSQTLRMELLGAPLPFNARRSQPQVDFAALEASIDKYDVESNGPDNVCGAV